jgi:hypothetical protein
MTMAAVAPQNCMADAVKEKCEQRPIVMLVAVIIGRAVQSVTSSWRRHAKRRIIAGPIVTRLVLATMASLAIAATAITVTLDHSGDSGSHDSDALGGGDDGG